MKDPKDFSVDEVCLFLVSLELGHLQDKIRDNGVDGGLLVSLSESELVGDLGLSGLQAKRVKRGIAFCEELAAGSPTGGGASTKELEEKIRHLEKENRELKEEVVNLRAALQPEPPRSAPPPQQQSHHHHQQAPPPSMGRPVIRGAAGGAARGAVVGAVAGAIAGDPGMGAKMGAAAGAAGGAMGGLGERRRARMMARGF